MGRKRHRTIYFDPAKAARCRAGLQSTAVPIVKPYPYLLLPNLKDNTMTFGIRTRAFALPVFLLFLSAPGLASGDAAWIKFNQRVTRSCIAASGIRNALPSMILGFDDRVGKVAQLISDRTRGSTLSKLCLYDKRTRTAFIDDADMWSAPLPSGYRH
jgi:hypothetical protein